MIQNNGFTLRQLNCGYSSQSEIRTIIFRETSACKDCLYKSWYMSDQERLKNCEKNRT